MPATLEFIRAQIARQDAETAALDAFRATAQPVRRYRQSFNVIWRDVEVYEVAPGRYRPYMLPLHVGSGKYTTGGWGAEGGNVNAPWPGY